MAAGFDNSIDFTPILGWELYQVTIDKYHVMFWFENGRSLLNVADGFTFEPGDGLPACTYAIYGEHKSLAIDNILRVRIAAVQVRSRDALELTFESGDKLIVHDTPDLRSWWFLGGQHADPATGRTEWAFEIGDREPEDMTDDEMQRRLQNVQATPNTEANKVEPATRNKELDAYGWPISPAERMQQVMLGLYDLRDEAREADFPAELLNEFNQLRLKFMDEFERRFPGYGKGRALWR
jgi:hypothetical protein